MLHHGVLRRCAWDVRGITPSGVPGLGLPLSWGLAGPVPARSFRFPSQPPRRLRLSRLGESSGQSPLRPRSPPSFLELGSGILPELGEQQSSLRRPGPARPPSVHPGALRTATGGGSSPGPPPAAASRGAGADPCAERLLRVKVCRELAHSGPGRGRLWGYSGGIHTTPQHRARPAPSGTREGGDGRDGAQQRPTGSALGPRDSRQQPPALEPRTK